MSSSRRFDGKTVIVTGASAGVGADVARAFASAGARLMLVARGKDALRDFAATLESTTKVATCAMDVSDTSACRDLIKRTQHEFGSVHYIINNAGAHHRGNFETIDADHIAQMVDVNLRAPLILTQLALPSIRESGGGAIVNIASIAGTTPVPGSAVYSATKFGLRAFTFALGEELRGSNVHVGVVSPGPIDTGFIMSDIDGVSDLTFSQPMSTPEEVADAVLRVALGERVEIKMPTISGILGDIGYQFPWVKRLLRPMLERKGRKAKAFYKARAATLGQADEQ
ncbi:MAG: SDR family NAD(P)-dependent oxidoreductase [Pseudomonadota bacterium]